MNSPDASHEEKMLDLPVDPLASSGLASIGIRGLPATTLSILSMFAFVAVLAIFQIETRQRTLFVLAFDPTIIAVPTTLLVWALAYHCRARPGRNLPRFWVLALALFNSALAAVSLLYPDLAGRGSLHALGAAGLASALMLLPRVLKLRPNSRMIGYVTPLSLLALALMLPSAFYSTSALQQWRVDSLIRRLRHWATEVERVTAHDWSHLANDPAAASAQVERLSAIDVEDVLGDPVLWQVAALLERDDDLAQEMRPMIDAVTAGINPEAPRLSFFEEPEARWDPIAHRWLASPQFPRLSAIVGDYYQQIGRLLLALETGGASRDNPNLIVGDRCEETRWKKLEDVLRNELWSWPDHWTASHVPACETLAARPDLPLAEVLVAPVGDAGSPSPSDLWKILRLPLARTRVLSSQVPGCYDREYARGSDEYFSLDCYAYTPSRTHSGAELRVAVRLVYGTSGQGRLDENQLPAEVILVFPLAPDSSIDAFHDQVMNDLAAAIRTFWNRGLRTTDTSGSVRSGFVMRDGDAWLSVYRPVVEPYLGQREALVVRADMVQARATRRNGSDFQLSVGRRLEQGNGRQDRHRGR